MKIGVALTWTGILILLLPVNVSLASDTIRIATGSEDGIYYPAGLALSRIIYLHDIGDAEVIPTSGTIENLKLLDQGQADLALVQSDILAMENPQNIYALGAVFPEYIQILVRTEDYLHRPADLLGRRVFLGKKGSGTRTNAMTILNALRLQQDDYFDLSEQFTLDQALGALIDQELDAVFWTGGDLLVNRPEFQPNLRMLNLSEEDQHRITSTRTHRHFGFSNITDHQGQKANAMFTRAVLVARGPLDAFSMNADEINMLLQAISSELEISLYRIHGRHISIFLTEQSVSGLPIQLHPAAEKFYREQGVLPNIGQLIILSATLWLLFFVMTYLRYANTSHKVVVAGNWADEHLGTVWKVIKFLTAGPVVLSIVFFLALLFTNVTIIIWFETGHAIQEHGINPFAGRPIAELLTWMLTIAGAGIELDLYPQSLQGRIFAAMIPLAGFVYAMALVAYNYIQKMRRDDFRARGVYSVPLRNHVIISGWNQRMPRLIREITSTGEWKKARKVLVIAEHEDEKPLARYSFDPSHVHYLRGSASNYKILDKSHLAKASSVIIVADQKTVHQENRRSVLTSIAIAKHLERTGRKDSVSIIAELFYPSNEILFRNAGVEKLVNLHRISNRLLIHACLNPGISDLVCSILSFTSRHSILVENAESQRLSKLDLVGQNYDQAICSLRKMNLLLLGIYANPGDEFTHEQSELEFRAQNSPYIINPSTQNERSRKIKPDDQLLLLCGSGDSRLLLKLASNLGKHDSTRCFNPGREHLLVIGCPDTGANSKIEPVLQCHASSVIYIDLDQKQEQGQPEITQDGPVLRCSLPQNDPRNFELLINKNDEVRRRFEKVTRALVFCPNARSELDGSAPSHQDDTTMAIAIAVKETYKTHFKIDLHVAAELRCESNLQLFHDIGIAQPVPTEMLIDLVLSRMAFHRGRVTEFLLKCMSYQPKNRKARLEKIAVAMLDPKLRESIVGLNFDDVLQILRDPKNNMQLMGFFRSRKDGGIIINPKPGSPDNSVALDVNDALIVFRVPPC